MSAPTIRTKVTADTVDFDKNMKGVAEQLADAGKKMKTFGNQTKTSGAGSLKKLSTEIKQTVKDLKPLAMQIGSVTKSIAKWSATSVAAAGVAGAAIVGTSLASIKELRNLAAMSDVSSASLQRGSFAAKTVGVDMETYAQALKDVNDRLGDFNATGAGPMVDFFEQIAPKVGITAAAFEGLNSEQSLALYVKTLEDANVSQQEMTFYMEAIAGDATKLIPLFANNAKQMKALKQEAKELGIGLSEIDVKQAMDAQSQLSKIGAIIKNELLGAVVELAPAITAMGKHLVDAFKAARKETGGLAGMVGNFMVGIAGYMDSIVSMFSMINRGINIVKGSLNIMTGNMKMAVGLMMQSVSSIVTPVLNTILGTIQFVGNAFSNGFANGIVDSLKMINLNIWDYLHYPLEQFYALLAKLPDDFGGDFFKAQLADVQELRKQAKDAKKELTEDVMAPNLDINTPMGQFNSMIDTMRTTAQENLENVLGTGGMLVQDGLQQGVDGGKAIMEGLLGSIDEQTIVDRVKSAFDAVKAETINRDESGEKPADPELTELSPEIAQSPMQSYASELQAFYDQTDLLLEAELFRFQSQNEIRSQQYNTEIQMLMDKQATEEGLTQQQEDRLNDLKKKSVEVNKAMMREDMQAGIQMLLQGSSKASKIMKKFAIAQAIIKGKDAAVSAWSAGMSTGGPFAPVVAAAYTAASIARTAGMINAIRSSGSSSGGGGTGGASAAVSQGQTQAAGSGGGQSAPSQPSRIFNVEFAGQSTTSTQQTRNLLELINEQAGDNVTINMRG